jgi:heterotetrameric sarcosine oxidase delta subunit
MRLAGHLSPAGSLRRGYFWTDESGGPDPCGLTCPLCAVTRPAGVLPTTGRRIICTGPGPLCGETALITLADRDNYLHLRDNPAGMTRDLWYHEAGCAQWLVVTRNTVTHEISGVELVAERAK